MGYEYYDYGTSYDASSAFYDLLSGLLAVFAVIALIGFIVLIIVLIANWKVFKKSGKGGWEVLVPFYCNWVLVEISGLNWWWFLFFFAPLATTFIGLPWLGYLAYLFAVFNCYYNLSKKFNKGVGFAICMTLFTPICLMILGFSKKNVYNKDIVVSGNGVIPDNKTSNDNSVNINNQNNVQPQNNNQTVNSVQPTPVVIPTQSQVVNTPVESVQNNVFDSVPQTLVEPTIQPIVQPTAEFTPTIEQTQIVKPVVEEMQPVEKKVCPNCGSPVNDKDKFCIRCGSPL